MKKMIRFALGLILLAFLYPAAFAAQEGISSNTKKIDLLFVLPAEKASISQGENSETLTLKIPDKKVIYFSDRPNRVSGNMSLEKFVQQWSKGKDSFKDDPPNAELVHFGSKKGVTLELTSIKLSKSGDTIEFGIIGEDNLTYDKGAFLFIDAALAEYAVILG